MMTIDGSFRENVRKYPEAIALRYYQETRWEQITYAEMNNAVTVVAYGLADLGMSRESKIAVMSENRPEWMVAYLAALTAGAIAIPIDAVLGEVETTHILNHSEAQAIVCSMRCYET